MFDYQCQEDLQEEYCWTQKVRSFNHNIYLLHLHVPELATELLTLAYESASYSVELFTEFHDYFPSKVSSVEDAKERELLFCSNLWEHLAYHITSPTDILTTPPERARLLRGTDKAVEKFFIEGLTRKDRRVRMEKCPLDELGKKYSFEELASSFGNRSHEWLIIKKYYRPTDELWEFRTPEPSWKFLAGREGFALVRDGYIIGEILTSMN